MAIAALGLVCFQDPIPLIHRDVWKCEIKKLWHDRALISEGHHERAACVLDMGDDDLNVLQKLSIGEQLWLAIEE